MNISTIIISAIVIGSISLNIYQYNNASNNAEMVSLMKEDLRIKKSEIAEKEKRKKAIKEFNKSTIIYSKPKPVNIFR